MPPKAPGQQPQWLWSASLNSWYWIDEPRNQFVLSDNRRIQRPPIDPRSTFPSPPSQPQASDHELNASGHQNNYRLVSGPQRDPASTSAHHAYSNSSQPLQQPSRSGQPSDSNTGAARQALGNLQLRDQMISPATQPRADPQSSSQRVVTTRKQGFVSARNDFNEVQTRMQTQPQERITDPDLANAGILAQGYLMETDGDVELLFDSYKKRSAPKKFFVFGRVFFVLWAEPQGETSTVATAAERGTSLNRYGEPVYSKARRFVVIREADYYCTCLSITTYKGQGVAKARVRKSEHSIIYTGKTAPSPRPNELSARDEQGMQPDSIRVSADDPSEKLSVMSRLDYGKVYTIHHNLKVRNFGSVHPDSKRALRQQFGNVFAGGAAVIGEPSSSRGTNNSGAPAPLRAAEPGREHRGSSHQQEFRTVQKPRDHGQAQRAGADHMSSRGSEPSARKEPAGPPQVGQASTAAAIQRMMTRGFTHAEAVAAIQRETQKQRASTTSRGLRSAGNDDEDDKDDGEDEEGDKDEDDEDESDDNNSQPQSSNGSRDSQTRRQAQSHRRAPLKSSSHKYSSARNQTHPQPSRSRPFQAQQPGRRLTNPNSTRTPHPHPQTQLQQQPSSSAIDPRFERYIQDMISNGYSRQQAINHATTYERTLQELVRQGYSREEAERFERAVQNLMRQGHSREEAERFERAVLNLMGQGYSRQQATDAVSRQIAGNKRRA